MDEWKDNRDNTLAQGMTVAYNYSGQIALGTIVSITESNRYGRKGVRIKVEQIAPHYGKESIVTSPKNVLVIYEE